MTRPGDTTGVVGVASSDAMASTLATELLRAFVAVLESDQELTRRLRAVLLPPERPANSPASPPFMTVAEYALHARLGVRTIRSYVPMMTEGLHYTRDGMKRRRITIDVAAADAWRASRRGATIEARSIEELANDEVLRRRARVALRKVRAR